MYNTLHSHTHTLQTYIINKLSLALTQEIATRNSLCFII